MKFMKLIFDDCAIKTYIPSTYTAYKTNTKSFEMESYTETFDITEVFAELGIKISQYAMRIVWIGKCNKYSNYYYFKKNLYSKDILRKESLGNCSRKNYFRGTEYTFYDIDLSNDIINDTVYSYKLIGKIKYNSGKYTLNNYTDDRFERYFLFNNVIYYCDNKKYQYSQEQLELSLKEFVYKENSRFTKLKREIELFQKISTENIQERKREPIPEEVRFEVWRRDEGKCVRCGSQENLEFDHIIPFSKGGASTVRNLQLLCEACNRKKSAII